MSQSLSDDEIKYSYIEKHAFALVMAIEKFHHFILSKYTQVKSPFFCCQVFAFTNLSFKKTRTLACQNSGA
jgi:hypothetical protein